MKKKSYTVAPKDRPTSVGSLVPWGGAYVVNGYCETHKYHYQGKICPVCDNTNDE